MKKKLIWKEITTVSHVWHNSRSLGLTTRMSKHNTTHNKQRKFYRFILWKKTRLEESLPDEYEGFVGLQKNCSRLSNGHWKGSKSHGDLGYTPTDSRWTRNSRQCKSVGKPWKNLVGQFESMTYHEIFTILWSCSKLQILYYGIILQV